MISRRSATAIANMFHAGFVSKTTHAVNRDALYEFLFNCNYPSWLCNAAKKLRVRSEVKPFFMRLHTGETQIPYTPNWTIEQRENLGQQYLRQLAEDILVAWQSMNPQERRFNPIHEELERNLELDGYSFLDGRLLAPETDVLDVRETAGVLEDLYASLGLARQDVAVHALQLSETHWLEQRWDDCIANARKFLESVLQEVAADHCRRKKKADLPTNTYERPFAVRDYLEHEGLLESKEKKALAEVYGLLSNTGSHPNIAQHDQARLLRQMALVLSQFVMLRYQSYRMNNP